MMQNQVFILLLLTLSTALTLTKPLALAGNHPKSTTKPKCTPGTVCYDYLETCTSDTVTAYMRWGDCYDTCTGTPSARLTCSPGFTDATDPKTTADASSGAAVTPTVKAVTAQATPAITSTPDPVATVNTGLQEATQTQDTPAGEMQTGVLRVSAGAWRLIEENTRKWFGRVGHV